MVVLNEAILYDFGSYIVLNHKCVPNCFCVKIIIFSVTKLFMRKTLIVVTKNAAPAPFHVVYEISVK
jgi:hypothetical protein